MWLRNYWRLITGNLGSESIVREADLASRMVQNATDRHLEETNEFIESARTAVQMMGKRERDNDGD